MNILSQYLQKLREQQKLIPQGEAKMKLIHKNFLDDLHRFLKQYDIREMSVIYDTDRIEFEFDDCADRMSIESYKDGVFTNISVMTDYKAEETELSCSAD